MMTDEQKLELHPILVEACKDALDALEFGGYAAQERASDALKDVLMRVDPIEPSDVFLEALDALSRMNPQLSREEIKALMQPDRS